MALNFESRVLISFLQDTITYDENLNVRSHETPESVFRRRDDGLAADVEACIHEDRATGQSFKGGQKRMICGVCFLV